MPDPLTTTERRILDYIVEYLRENTYQPSIREIGRRFGIKSTKTVSEHLQALSDKGYVEREASRSRGVRIFDLQLGAGVRIPCYGKIAAGQPELLRENAIDEFALDARLAEEDSFFMQVDGDSMDEVGILDGDLVLVREADRGDLSDGDIIAARVGGEGTVKRFFERDGEVVLEPANPDYAPLLMHASDDFAVLGKVVGLFRRFTQRQASAAGS